MFQWFSGGSFILGNVIDHPVSLFLSIKLHVTGPDSIYLGVFSPRDEYAFHFSHTRSRTYFCFVYVHMH